MLALTAIALIALALTLLAVMHGGIGELVFAVADAASERRFDILAVYTGVFAFIVAGALSTALTYA